MIHRCSSVADMGLPLCFKMVGLLIICALGTGIPSLAQTTDQDRAFQAALGNLKMLETTMPPVEKAQIPSLKAIIHRVFYEYDQATPTEVQVASVIITGDPNALDGGSVSGGKGLNDRPPKLLPLRFHFVPIIAVLPAALHDKRHFAKSRMRLSLRQQEHYLRPVHEYLTRMAHAGTTITYRSAVLRQPGGKADGVVEMEKNGRRTKIVEIPTSTGAMDLDARAKKIADRLRKVQGKDATWWTRIEPGRTNGEEVVNISGQSIAGISYLVTADQDFAKEWGLTPEDLAARLVRTIRGGIEHQIGGKGLNNDARQLAITSKQKGDDSYSANDKDGAEQQYQKAIEADPSYAPAYVLLISLYKEEEKPNRVKDVLGKALGAPLKDTDVQEIQTAVGPM